jgi:hypothetical protein
MAGQSYENEAFGRENLLTPHLIFDVQALELNAPSATLW